MIAFAFVACMDTSKMNSMIVYNKIAPPSKNHGKDLNQGELK